MAILIKTSGDCRDVFPKKKTFSLEEMYNLLECSCVQVIHLQNEQTMWIDEEGKLKPHQINIEATKLLIRAGGCPGDYIAGSALITDSREIN